jgi:succinyldiaminopimelate transaminase
VRYNPLLQKLPTYPTVVLDQIRDRLLSENRPVYDFGTGDPLEPTPAFIRKAMLTSVPDNCRYPTVKGELSIRQAFADYAKRRFGVSLDPASQILPSSGSKEVVFHLPMLTIDPSADDKIVLFPDPGYSVCYRGSLLAGAVPVPVPLSGDMIQRIWELPPEILKKTRLLWINSPHNPTGAVLSRDDLQKTWETCQEYGILLASDECYADVWFDKPPASILEISQKGVLAIFSLSKRSGMTGYRTGIVAGDPDVMARLHSLRTNPGLAPQDFVNAAATVAWQDDSHAEARRQCFARKRKIMLDFIQKEAGLEVVASQAGFYLWVRAPKRNGAEYAQELLQAGILTNPGGAFAVTNSADAFVRFALVPDEATCQQAVAAWRAIL